MSRPFIAFVFLFSIIQLIASNRAAAEEGVTATAVAVSVAKPFDAEAFEYSPLQGQTGTKVSVLIDLSESKATIVGLDDDASEVTAFTDVAGNDLLKDENQAEVLGMSFNMSSSPIGSFPSVSKDGKLIVLDFQAPSAPAAGSGSVNIKATVVLNVADGTKVRKAENLALKAGTVVDKEAGITIDSAGDADWGDAAMAVTLKMPSATLDQIAAIKFLDAAGNDITDGRSSTMTMMGTAEAVWNLTKKVDKATLELTLHDRMRKLTVPVDLTVTMGL